jgi:phosphopantothenoylcysteine decarboxylase / phosphopantothenate---cysteine ligase
MGRSSPLLVGFAAEVGDPVPRARVKLRLKQADMIVANDVSRPDAGFDLDFNAVTLVTHDGEEPLPVAAKTVVAAVILDRTERLLAAV